MSTLGISKTGEFVFSRDNAGSLVLETGKDKISSILRSQLSVLRGAYFLDPDFGFNLNETQIELRDDVATEILAVDGVEGLKNFVVEFDEKSENLKIEAIVSTIFGALSI